MFACTFEYCVLVRLEVGFPFFPLTDGQTVNHPMNNIRLGRTGRRNDFVHLGQEVSINNHINDLRKVHARRNHPSLSTSILSSLSFSVSLCLTGIRVCFPFFMAGVWSSEGNGSNIQFPNFKSRRHIGHVPNRAEVAAVLQLFPTGLCTTITVPYCRWRSGWSDTMECRYAYRLRGR